jgi:predicted butyrate kinase (DUF1464 family)
MTSPLRVAGADPGTSSLDLLVLSDGIPADQVRFTPDEVRADASAPVRWLEQRGPFALVAGPSGHGLPLVHGRDCSERDFALMSLVRPDERGRSGGVSGFSALVRALAQSPLPVVYLPGVIHLPTVPTHRKLNRIDLGTPDKLCVAALSLTQHGGDPANCTRCVVEVGSAFTACVVIERGQVVDGIGGTSGPVGWGSLGGWDGEMAYLLSPLGKRDLFNGGAGSVADRSRGRVLFLESLQKTVAGLQSVTPFDEIVLSGRLLETEPDLARQIETALAALRSSPRLARLPSLPGVWVKHAAQGAAILADGLASGRYAVLVNRLRLREASGTVLDWLSHPRAVEVRAAFGL